jgi:predicted NBD/HSP70 family sugar kinase
VTEIALASPRRPRAGLGELLTVFRGHPSLTRSDVAEVTGLSRATVNQRLEALLAAGVIAPADGQAPRRGRPAERFAFNATRGILLLVDIGATGMRAALCDLSGGILQERFTPSSVTDGPEAVLPEVQGLFAQMLAATGHTPEEVEGIGLDVPGPVDFDAGLVISPPIMTGWDRYDIRGWFSRHYPCPVVVEKDANAMVFGEHRLIHPDVANMLYLKLGTGIGSGIIANGQIYRGADGAAGDIGHNQIPIRDDAPEPLCRCGNTGCVEAYAGGWAMVRDLQAAGLAITTVDQAVEAIKAGDPTAVRLARRTGRILGAALSDAVSLLNPRVVVLGGQLAAAEAHLYAGLREMIYRRSLPLATRHLQIIPSQLDRRAGVVGLGYLVADHVFDPVRVEQALSG